MALILDPATQTFRWSVDHGDSGNYTVTFMVTDNGTPPLSDQETVTITVGDVDVPPLPPGGLRIIVN